jgi:hypothetical protein
MEVVLIPLKTPDVQPLGCGCMFKRRGTSFGYDRCEDKNVNDIGFEL